MNNLKEQKGQSLQILFFSLIVLGLAVGVITFAQVSAAPNIFADTMSDAPVISEAQSRASDIAHHYIPLAAHYSVAEAVWDNGQQNDLIDTRTQLENHYINQPADIENQANQILDDDYIEAIDGRSFPTNGCSIGVPDKYLIFLAESDNVTVVDTGGGDDFVNVECNTAGLDVMIEEQKDEIVTGLSNIRWHELMTLMMEGLEAAWDESEEIADDGDYTGTVTGESACYIDDDGEPWEDKEDLAEEEAFENAEEEAWKAVDDVLARIEDAAYDAVDDVEVGEEEDGGIFDVVIDFVTFWSSDDGFDWDFNVEENESSIETHDVEFNDCECLEWDCEGYIDDDTYDSDDGNICEHEDEPFDDPHCDSYDDLEHDGGGECEPENRPSVCSSGSYNESTGVCEDNDGDFEEWPCDDDWDYTVEEDGGDYECIHDDEGSDAECESDAATVSGGSCVHDGDRPDPVCTLQPVEAEVDADYEVESYLMQAWTQDIEFEIPVSDGWQNLIIERRLSFTFPV